MHGRTRNSPLGWLRRLQRFVHAVGPALDLLTVCSQSPLSSHGAVSSFHTGEDLNLLARNIAA